MKRSLPLLANLASGVIFGFAMLFIKSGMAVVRYDTVKFLFFRYMTGFVVMSVLLACGLRRADYRGKPPGLLLLCGLINPLISQVLETAATTHAPTSQIAVFESLIPVAVVVISVFLNREVPSLRQVLFMLVSVGGMLLIRLTVPGAQGGSPLGVALTAGAVAMISLQRVLVRRASAHFSAFEIIYVTTAMGAAGFGLITGITHAVSGGSASFFDCLREPRFLVSVAYMGVGSCVVAFLLMTYASANLPIAVSASTGTLNTVVAVAVGALLLGEPLRALDIIGTLVILAGIVGMSFSYRRGDPGNRFRAAGGQPAAAAR